MHNTSPDGEASELSYQGPLIGMRSTRPKTSTENVVKKSAESKKSTVQK